MKLDIYVVSAFSKHGMGGNTAGVVLLTSKLSDNKKTQIAFQLGYSETVFVSQSENADFKLEYYTPMGFKHCNRTGKFNIYGTKHTKIL